MANKTIKSNNRKNINQTSCYTFKLICIILMLILFAGESNRKCVEAATRQKRDMADSFTNGLKYAGQMFGINTAADVANLVAKAFSNAATATTQTNTNFLSSFFPTKQQQSASQESEEETSSSNEPQQQATHEKDRLTEQHNGIPSPAKEDVPIDFSNAKLVTSVLRMIGFDARKLGALAINALIMIAQAIGTTLMGTFKRKNFGVSAIDGGRFFMQQDQNSNIDDETINENEYHGDSQPRSLRDGSPLDWFLENPSKDMTELLKRATDKKLADELTNIIEKAEKKSVEGENSGACLKMFVCKSSPFIWGMQKSLEKRLKGTENIKNKNDEKNNETKILNTSMFYTHLPSINEFREHSAICQQRYGVHCKISY